MLKKADKSGMLVAAPTSGSGKTLITLALLRTFKNMGYLVAGAKAGPDYIDPAFHALASGVPSVNLDPWAMGENHIATLADDFCKSGLLVEGMMGLYDGAADGTGSAADLAKQLSLPILLVVDATKQSHSIAALVRGFKDHRDDIEITGIILNKVGSARHEAMLKDALRDIDVKVFGSIPRMKELELPERHLGLVQAEENIAIDQFIEAASKLICQHCDIETILKQFGKMPLPAKRDRLTSIEPLGQTIAVAKDEAFSFIYPHLLKHWQKMGCQISYFSPLADQGPGADCDSVYLPGGYPELHGERLSNAENFKNSMHSAAKRGALIYGECGGYMVLGDRLIDRRGVGHSMLGLLGLETSFHNPKLHLGYRHVKGAIGEGPPICFKAHEFHYTRAVREEGKPLFTGTDALGTELTAMGLRVKNVMGSYIHLIDRVEH